MGNKKRLELTIISASQLKKVNLIGKMDVYVTVSLSGTITSQKMYTRVHRGGGSSPSWNQTLSFILNESALELDGWMVVFDLKHMRTFGQDKSVGQVRVPANDLVKGFSDGIIIKLRTLTYKVQSPSKTSKKGHPGGELKFSYRVTDVIDPPKVVPRQLPKVVQPQPPPQPRPQTAYVPSGGYGSGYGCSSQGYGHREEKSGFGMGLVVGLAGGILLLHGLHVPLLH